MDTRFPPQPVKTKVPLYPNTYVIRKSLPILFGKTTFCFRSWVASHYSVEPHQIFLANRGCEALMVFLQWMALQQNSCLRIAIPSFCCREVSHAILSAGATLFFLELNDDGTLSESSIYRAKEAGCQVVIFPHYFGDRFHSHGVLIKKLGMLFINDEAQSFPSKSSSIANITLFSCGPSKKLAGIGGGGLCIHDIDIARSFYQKGVKTILQRKEVASQIQNILKRRFVEFNRPLSQTLGFAPHLENDLEKLLEKTGPGLSPMTYTPMSEYQQHMSLAMFHEYTRHYEDHLLRTEQLKTLVEINFGTASLSLIREIKNPSIFAIRVPNRYEISSLLSQQGIQTTWYYYPLNRLSYLRHFPTEETPTTDMIAKEILILPFQWKHSIKQFTTLCEAIGNDNLWTI